MQAYLCGCRRLLIPSRTLSLPYDTLLYTYTMDKTPICRTARFDLHWTFPLEPACPPQTVEQLTTTRSHTIQTRWRLIYVPVLTTFLPQ